ncbi:CAT RNA binding domain-containing protein [Tetragenococcus halophilus]|uniref:CAT RNA-binding domain-containing protein n=1 Tax=Tetragenococcus halophilus TaxID=51669 RepID=A0AB35HLG2_TETHA|nr:CAT RNA binding domain-containing protein [Tetragenococcus halophilus]MCF1685134.1 hypothetical protein [Tetragenococcus halophilus]MCO8293545.1 hypothetical protein [Tetragenococcus halophilus]MCO8297058.1 hypothetical protein [Tetragenococcus halophilus]GFK29831.1 hypothetical protein YG2_22650 [Tetragenococcus halophilus]GLL50804.1 hypothetical protein YA5_007770 [Tetragenococcus halophilus]
MKIVQVFSHNALAAENVDGKTMVLVGKGIGFNRHKGDRIDKNIATKIYVESKQ